MSGKRRSGGQIARDRRRIADLYLQGWIQADIAQELEISQSTVSRDISALCKQWLKSALIDFNEAKALELARINRLEREYWAAWERSKEDAEAITTKGRGTGERPDSVEKTVQRKGQVGDASFLRGVQWCIEQRCKILGIEAASRVDVTTGGESLNDGKISAEQHARTVASLLAALADQGGRGDSGAPGAVGAAE